ncbi:MAG: hypothetical protein EXR79_08875 [Myxococcales bacterium]|nr:hypothetical protein [Myxococcales bacterium]
MAASIAGAALVAGCTMGIQQIGMAPPAAGRFTFTGVDLTARTPPSPTGQRETFEVRLPAESGNLPSIYTAPMLMFGFDAPFLRMSTAFAVVGGDRIVMGALDLLYKHRLGDDPSRWRVLGGLSMFLVEAFTRAEQVLTLAQPILVDGATLQSGDRVQYQATDMHMAWAVTGGAEYQITDWSHFYVQASLLGGDHVQRGQNLQITARSGATTDGGGQREAQTFQLLSDTRFDVALRQNGVFSTDLVLPSFTALVGVSVTFPTFGFLRTNVKHTPQPFQAPAGPDADPSAPILSTDPPTRTWTWNDSDPPPDPAGPTPPPGWQPESGPEFPPVALPESVTPSAPRPEWAPPP